MSERVAWVTGAGGFIGSHLSRAAPKHAPGWRVLGWTQARLDLTDRAAVTRAFLEQRPAAILHGAALSRGTVCEADPARAELVNVQVTQHLCELAQDIPLLFLSTDMVFDGRKGRYVETDPVGPLSVYAATKARAEEQVLRNPRHTVVRLALTTGISPTGDRSFTEEMRRAWGRGETLTLFRDEFRSPLPAPMAAQAIWELLRTQQPGLFHLGGSERLSRWEIGQVIARRWAVPESRLREGWRHQYQGPSRPADVSMDSARLQALLSFPLPGLREWAEANPTEPV